MTAIELFAVDWNASDRLHNGASRYEISVLGKTKDREAIHLRVPFTPYFFAALPASWSEARQKYWLVDATSKYKALHGISRFVERTPLLGFTNNAKRQYAQLAFNTIEAFKKAKWALQRENVQTYDASLDPLLRFFHIRDITPASWLHVTDAVEVPLDDPGRVSIDGVREFIVQHQHVHPLPSDARPPLVIASWDIECISEAGNFPDSSKPGDTIITIGTAYQRYGEDEPFHRSVVALDTCDAIEGVHVVSCATEADVINEWLAELREFQVDVLVGYNTFQFDYAYLDGRGAVLIDDDSVEPLVNFGIFGKYQRGGGIPIQKKLTSSAYGENNYFYHSSPGVLSIDLLQIFRKELKLDSYSLSNVSAKYLDGANKIDLKPHHIFQKFRGTSRDRADIAEYCVRDVELPLQLMRKMSTLENLMQMANAVCCPVEFLQTRGQQIRVFSLLMRKARTLGFVCPDLKRPDYDNGVPPEKYVGATVLDAQRGAYFQPIAALDFASLYPSIMRAHCMCPSTLVIDKGYAAVPGVEYYSVETAAARVSFAQNVPCVVPLLLQELAEFRKKAKRDMADASRRGDAFMSSMFNGKQLAYKVSMNSIYGFFGATRGMLPLVDLAAAVTATGRHMIMHSKAMAETLVPGTEVVYGDSVAEYTPLFVRSGDERSWITTFEMLAQEMTWTIREDGKEYAECGDDMYVWSDAGWTRLERLIRHTYDPTKGLIRVLTDTGLVDVTPDHSLVTADGQPVKPSDVAMGDVLLHADVPSLKAAQVVTDPDRARTMGFCMGAGTCGTYSCPSWALNNEDKTGYSGSSKVVPECILGASHDIRQAFWEGLCDADGDKDHKSQLSASSIFTLLSSLGHRVSLECRDDKPHSFLVSQSTTQQKHPDAVKKILPIAYDGSYVYDATTSNHHFAAGPGRMVVHNTDSILCKFKVADHLKEDMHEHFRVAEHVASEITKTFAHPIELEFEKVYSPFLLFSKKRYAGLMWTNADASEYIDVKGLQLVRRDSPPMVKCVSNEILRVIMYDRSVEQAIATARDIVFKVLSGNYPLEQFIVSKALRSGYKNPASLPHVTVAKKLRERGNPPAIGERVPYVFIRDAANPDGLQAQRAEDPEFVREHAGTIELDTLYYVQNQLLNPIVTLLEVLTPNGALPLITEYPPIAQRLQELETARTATTREAKRVRTNTANRQKEITSFFNFRKDE